MTDSKLKPLLVVEDHPGLQKQLKWSFEGYTVYLAADRVTAIEQVKKYYPPVVTLDLGLPPDPTNASEGLAVLEDILRLAPHTKVIVVTGNDDRENALKAIALGAYDFYQKPVDPDILGLIVDRAYALFELEQENRRLAERATDSSLTGIVASSSQMMAVCRIVEKVGPSAVTALVLGESGTGKELIARALHELSPRRNKRFVTVNCAAIPENLLESELFGYEKGAFTGAVKQTLGKIEYADGGSLFLDEIGDMPLSLQAKMLRFLQERIIERIGGRTPIPVDVRIICATHQDPENAIEAGTFRADLYFRISEIIIEIPPLSAREGDKLLLARHFLNNFSKENDRTFRGFTQEAQVQIETYNWPGNVRELENKIKRAVVLADGDRITIQDLGFKGESNLESLNLWEARERVERQYVQRAMVAHDNNISRAAEALGISRPSLYAMVKRFGIAEPGNP